MSGTAPDYAAPLEAWRTWKVVPGAGGMLLSSLFFDLLWPPRAAVRATCLRRSWLHRFELFRQEHRAPGSRCECGLYAATLEQAVSYLWHPSVTPRQAPVHVLGRVLLWGEVIECQRGYRASAAYPAVLFLPAAIPGRGRLARAAEIAESLAHYEVPVELVECRNREELIEQARGSQPRAA